MSFIESQAKLGIMLSGPTLYAPDFSLRSTCAATTEGLLFMYLRAILCTFQISVDFYFVPVSGRGVGRGGLEKGRGLERGG